MPGVQAQENEKPQHLKQVSRIKHIILQKYLPAWERILGSRNGRLCYVDCYAGPGVYEFEGQEVDGSPMIAVRAANRSRTCGLIFMTKPGVKAVCALCDRHSWLGG